MKNKEWNRAYMREYNKTDAQHARSRIFMRAYRNRPEVVERHRLNRQSEEYKIAKQRQDRAYYLAHKDRIDRRAHERRLSKPVSFRVPKSPEATREYRKVYDRNRRRIDYWLKRDAYLARAKLYATRHPERVLERNHRRRVMLRGLVGNHTRTQWLAKLAYYGWRCYYCKIQLEKPTQDHAIPVKRGGTDWLSNILPACRSCNSRKRLKTVFEWRYTPVCP